MSVPTLTLADFLLARIAEDEALTWTLSPYKCPPGCCAPEGWVGAQCRHCDPSPVYGGTVDAMTSSAEEHAETIHQRSRVLAECDAKRRIVNWAQYVDGGWIVEQLLPLLALPYADHPEYREEWRA